MEKKKGKVLGLLLLLITLPVLYGGQAYGEEVNSPISESSDTETMPGKESKSSDDTKELVIPINISPKSITAVEGASGKLTIEKFEDIEIKGTFKEVKDNPLIEMKKDGTWKAKKTGTTQLASEFKLSAETLEEINQKYPGTKVQIKDSAQTINVTINPKSIQVPIDISPGSIISVEGETGQLTVGKFEGIELNGSFKEIMDNPLIELSKDGRWKAKQAGTTTIVPVFELSSKALEAIEKKYPGTEIQLKDIAQTINVTVNPEVLQIPISISPGSLLAIEGQTGQLTVGKFEGIELKGTFKEIKDNPLIELSKEGFWKAKQAGTTTFVPEFQLSAETINEIAKRYPGTAIEFKDIAQVISVKINPESILIPINFSPETIIATEGESGQLTVGKFEGIELKGTFKEIKDNAMIELNKDGVWLAKQAGTTTIIPSFELSEHTLKEIQKKYPGTAIYFNDIAQVINVTVNQQKKANVRNNTIPSSQVKQVNGTKTGKALPKTGDSKKNTMVSIAGLGLVCLSIVFFRLVRRKQKNV